jgi:glucose-6-phosphate 1-dehydrogenase
MEPPAVFRADEIRDEKRKVLRSLIRREGADVDQHVVRGQYGPGTVEGKSVTGYRSEPDVAADSKTETFVALRAEIDNWRWAGVPFLLRAGKRLARRATEIAVFFKVPPLRLFLEGACDEVDANLSEAQPNVLAFRIQPDEGISLSFLAKRPGMSLDLYPVRMEFQYERAFGQALPEAYERLLLDALRGDATLFMRSDELTAAWEFITPILERWKSEPPPAFPNYAAGTWGPAEMNRLLPNAAAPWREP